MLHQPLAHEKAEAELRHLLQAMQSDHPVRIPAERVLSERLGVSRVTLRRAMARLVAEGLLQQRQGTGTYLQPETSAGLPPLQLLRSPDIKPEDPFYLTFLTALTTYASSHGLRLTLMDAGTPDMPVELDRDEPVVVIGPIGEALAQTLLKTHARIVSIHGGGRLAQEAEVRFDDRNIGRTALELLVHRGFRQLALLAGPERYDSAADRRRGFLEAAAQHRIPVRVLEEKMNWGGGVRLAETLLLDREAGTFPDAVFAANDWMALGLMQRMRDAGVSIPGRLSVIGCDNIPLSEEYSPALATFDLGMERVVAEMVELLQRSPQPVHGCRILLPAVFVERESLGAKEPFPETPGYLYAK
jgi:DNA-binding LacI/PurR family transcriptional regulator